MTPTLVLGVGARDEGTERELSELISQVLGSHDLAVGRVTLVATLDRRSDHPALVRVAELLEVSIMGFAADTLAVQAVPTPSDLVRWRTGTSGVAEAAVLASGAKLIVNKHSSDNFTLAVGTQGSGTLAIGTQGAGTLAADRIEVDLSHHGDAELGAGLVDFAVNVAVPAPPAWLRRELDAALDGVAHYPGTAAANAALALLHACPSTSVLVTNGAAEAFTLIARARPWRKPLVVHPQFTEPESALQAHGHVVTRMILGQDNGFTFDPDRVPADADLVIIGNPTNPTSRLHSRTAILSLLSPGRLVVVDEAFMDVVAGEHESVLDDATRREGIVVIRSLTKTFGLAGIRAGYLVGSSEIVAECAATQPHWSVNSLAAAAVVACSGTQAQQHVQDVRAAFARHLPYLVATLAEVGLDVVPDPAGPFVLVCHLEAARLREGLRRRGFAVRRGDTFPGLGPEWLRIAAREPEMTDDLAAAISLELKDLT